MTGLLPSHGEQPLAVPYAYKVEELLALRDSVSESAVSLDRFADEDVIKEHVLRPTASANLIRIPSEKNLRSSTAPAVAPGAAHKKPSPSPSVKRGKAERLLKEHGSPPGMRVTAGGRVVPSDLPPLSAAHFANFKPQALRAVIPGSTMSTQSQSDVNTLGRIQMIGNQAVICVGDRMFALPSVNANATAMATAIPGPLEAATKQATEPALLSAQGGFANVPYCPPRTNTQTPFAGLDLPTLKAQQALKRQELRTVEQTEVLQASSQGDAWRTGMIGKKRNLIVELDALRKQILAAETDNTLSIQSNAFAGAADPPTAPLSPSSFVSQFQQPVQQPVYSYPTTGPYASMLMYQPPFGGFQGVPPAEPSQFLRQSTNAPHSPGSASRRSHAIEIKPPHDGGKKQAISALDPKSPTYQPVGKSTTAVAKVFVPPTPSPDKRRPWRSDEIAQSDKREDRVISQKPSLSSIDTTDFFPTNTHEFSSTRVAPKPKGAKQASNENNAVSTTPEKHWPASPWNEGNTARSGTESVTKLGPWPEAFGKQPSLSSLRPTVSQERAPFSTADAMASGFTSNISSRNTFDQRTGTDENWPLVNSKPIIHVPSTYQEGFQAGYDHVGLPDSPEVLQGYVSGLLQFIDDEAKRGRIPSNSGRKVSLATADSRSHSLRGLLVGSTPHDSAVSLTFNRGDMSAGTQENIRSSKANPMASDLRKESVYSRQGNVFTLCHEAAQDARARQHQAAMYFSPVESSDKVEAGFRHIEISLSENEVKQKQQDKATQSRTDASLSASGYPRQFSGNQLGGRFTGTPVSMQRYYLTPKEYGPRGFSADVLSSTRPLANHRLSGLDGAMDDLAELVLETYPGEQQLATEAQRSTGVSGTTESPEADASCFRPSSSKGKGKQKLPSSPSKSVSAKGIETGASSPPNPPVSPKKSGEHSPAKAKLEQVTNKFRRGKRDDPRTMSPDEKRERSKRWQHRFMKIREAEKREIEEYTARSHGSK